MKTRESLEADLRSARELYMTHFKNNHTQARELLLKAWGNMCMRLRAELESAK